MATQASIVTHLRTGLISLEQRRLSQPIQSRLLGVKTNDKNKARQGLVRGALHEFTHGPAHRDDGAAVSLIAGLLARARGTVLWILPHRDLYAPALAAVGLHPARLIFAEAGKNVLAVLEDALRQGGLTAVVGETSTPTTLGASRKLQLAAEASNVAAFLLRSARSRKTGPGSTAAETKWQVASIPSPPPFPDASYTDGLARARWRLELLRCRSGSKPNAWIVEGCDAQGCIALVSDATDRSLASFREQRAA